MILKFWGVRGSIPTPLTQERYTEKVKEIIKHTLNSVLTKEEEVLNNLPFYLRHIFGGNTSSVSIEYNNKCIILDAGSGLKELGNYLLQTQPDIDEYHIFLSHLHWDHIIGIPFFVPVYMPNKNVHFYNDKTGFGSNIKNLFKAPNFPIAFTEIEKTIFFHEIKVNETLDLYDLKISFSEGHHPGGCINTKVQNKNGKIIIYATDNEYKELDKKNLLKDIEFFKNADVLIFDAQYSFLEAYKKRDWGHSTNIIGVDISVEADVKHLLFFHHEPNYDDKRIFTLYEESVKYKKTIPKKNDLKISIAFEGMEVEI